MVLVRYEMMRWRMHALVCGAMAMSSAALGLMPACASAARHYEMVTPVEKGQGDVVGDGTTTAAAHSGDAVAFSSRAPFGDTVGSGAAGLSHFVARRGESGWTSRAITPMSRPDALQTFFVATLVQIFSEDLRTAVVWAYDLPEVSGDSPLRNNIYVEDTLTRELRPVTVSQVAQPMFFDFLSLTTWGISGDARHVTFVTGTQFLPEAAPGVPNVYQWDDGVLSLAGILPDGSVPTAGSNLVPSNYRRTMSLDGTRLVFTVPSSDYGPSQLFMRIRGARTVWISQPELTDDPQDPSDDLENASNPSAAALQGVTPDGRTVFFTTDAGLVDRDVNGSTDLYRYVDSADPSGERGNLTMISQGGEMDGGVVVGMSDDGARVYHQTTADRVSVWDRGTTRLISTAVPIRSNFTDRLGVMDGQPGLGRVTPDGRFLAFALDSAGAQDLLGNPTNGHREMYLYDFDADTLRCISCPVGPASADVSVAPRLTPDVSSTGNVGFRPRFLSDRGHVFFSTAEALVAQDRNGISDTYGYDPATRNVNLLSTGKGSDPMEFADASASGDDVFFVTRQRLLSADLDDLIDVYDAREGSSLTVSADQTPAPCQGDACKPAPSASPPTEVFGSSNFDQSDTGVRGARGLVVRSRVTLRGASGLVRVKLPSAGTLAWRGRGVQTGSFRGGRAGRYEVRLRLKRHARTRLRRSGAYTTSVHLAFVPAGGPEAKRTTRVTFRAVAKKGR